MTHSQTRSPRAGLLVPLFSIASSRSWGIGEIGDLESMTAWLERAGQRLLLMLPINEMPPGESSPYSALSAMAIDPQFITLPLVEDFEAIGGEAAFEPAMRAQLEAVRGARTIDYASVRALKQVALHRSFEHFTRTELSSGSSRASRFRAYVQDQAWWLNDYALFRALHANYDERSWTEWPAPLRHRDEQALDRARQGLANDILFRQYVQWIADSQWASVRARSHGIALLGDLPFMVSGDSADVWVHQDEFQLDLSVGVPPDAFSATGQDWGLPAYRWDVLAERDFLWLRQRARRNADLFDGYRIDHLVGFYRMYTRPFGGGEGTYTPAVQSEQVHLGERILRVFSAAGAEIIAEDLGVVPDFVRESLAVLEIPGYRVFRWERCWKEPGQPFRDPVDYPALSVATSGTHDTEPLVIWWESAAEEERSAVLAIPSVAVHMTADERALSLTSSSLEPSLRNAILEALFRAGSGLLIVPVQDVFGWRDRINQPATVSDKNWTWKLPWHIDHWRTQPDAVEVAERLRHWAQKSGRSGELERVTMPSR